MSLLVPAASLGGVLLYSIAILSLRPALRRGQTGAVPSNAVESVARVGAIAWNAWLNFMIWTHIAPAWGRLPGVIVATIGILSAVRPVARCDAYQALLGWASWLMPMSWPATGLGLAAFAISWISTLWGTRDVRVDRTSGVVEVAGLPVVADFRGGFALGSFTFIVGVAPTPFSAVGISAHEAGHAMNVAAFGSAWHLLGNGIEQNVRPFARGAHAYGELLAESRRPDQSQPVLLQWS